MTHDLEPIKHVVSLTSPTFEDALEKILDTLLAGVSQSTRRSLAQSIIRREQLRPTVLPHGAAFPRGESDRVKKIVCAVGVSEKGIVFDNQHNSPVHTVFVSLYPTGQFKSFVPVLEGLVRLSQDPARMASIQEAIHGRNGFADVSADVSAWGIGKLVRACLPVPALRFHSRTGARVR